MLQTNDRPTLRGVFTVTCRDKDGRVKWQETAKNLIVNEGLDHYLDVVLAAGTQITTWYIGLKNAGAGAAGDTMLSHAGWTENENYSEAVRQTFTAGAVSGQSVDNTASAASFSIDTDSQTIAGMFLVSNSTKGGTTGVLHSVTDFASAKSADNGDTLDIEYTVTMADDGV